MNTNAVVIGAGGCGRNILKAIQPDGKASAALIHINMDRKSIEQSTIQPGVWLERLDGELLLDLVDYGSHDPVILAAGMGGVTGSWVAPILAHAAQISGRTVFAVVTMPLGFEGKTRSKKAGEVIRELSLSCKYVFVLHNDELYKTLDTGGPVADVFNAIDGFAIKTIKMLTEEYVSEDIDVVVDRLQGILRGGVTVNHNDNVIDIT
jgi:cell division protein FtsZ